MFFWAQICVVLLPSSFLCSSSLEKCETLKNAWIKTNMTLLSPKHQGIIDIILIMDTKHSSVPVIKKKMNPIPAEIRTKLLMKLWRVPWRKPCIFFSMRKVGEAEISTSKGKGKRAGCRWVVLVGAAFLTALLPTTAESQGNSEASGFEPAFKISTLVKANSVYVMITFPEFPFFLSHLS